MAQSYLKKFNDVIKKRQTDQIVRLLNKQKQSGQIRTIQEFLQKLETLVTELSQAELIPTLKVFKAEENDPADSDTFNFMLERVRDDLEAAFEESINISEVQKSHEAIIRDVVLKNLQFGIAELESKVALFEFLATDRNGFQESIFSTFRESKQGRTGRGVEQATSIFTDPRRLDFTDKEDDADVDLIGERLTLGNELKTIYNIRSIRQIFDDSSTQTNLEADPASINLTNLIDNTKGTYWIQSLLFEKKRSQIRLKLELDLQGTQSINFVEVEPASKYGIILESVDFLDGNGTIVNVLKPDLVITAPAGVRFRKVTTNRVILTFRNENYECIQFERETGRGNLFDQAIAINTQPIFVNTVILTPPSLTNIDTDLTRILAPSIREILPIKEPEVVLFSGFQFTTGLDNIRIGLTTYRPRGIYVSSPLEIKEPGLLGLKTIETRPSGAGILDAPIDSPTTYNTSDSTFFHSSIEYWAIQRDFDDNDNILKTAVFPILPVGVTRIHHERLVLTEKSTTVKTINDQSQTMFYTDRPAGNVKVYRNGIELPSADDNTAVNDGWLDITTNNDKTANKGARMKLVVEIQKPLLGDIFTISYNPLVSTTIAIPKTLVPFSPNGISVVDLVGDLSARTIGEQIVKLDETKGLGNVVKSELRLLIMIRNNTADSSLSAAVEEYMLLVGKKDLEKFRSV